MFVKRKRTASAKILNFGNFLVNWRNLKNAASFLAQIVPWIHKYLA